MTPRALPTREWKSQLGDRSFSLDAPQGEPTITDARKSSAQIKPYADAAVEVTRGVRSSKELVEELRLLRGGNADSLIGDRDDRIVAVDGDRHFDHTARGRILDRIVEKVDDDVEDAFAIAMDHRGLEWFAELELTRIDQRTQFVESQAHGLT